MKVWVKKTEKTFPVPEYKSNQQIPNAQAEASFSAGSSTTTAETSNYGGGVTSTTCPSVVQSNACIGAFHPRLPYNHNNGEDLSCIFQFLVHVFIDQKMEQKIRISARIFGILVFWNSGS